MAHPHQLNNHKNRYHGKTITTLYLRIESLAGQDRALRELRCDHILSHFSAFGDVKSVRLRNITKRPFGFVKFAQPESAAKALQTKIHTIAKCRVEINVANDRYQIWGFLLLDLNDDCLLEILSAKSLSVWDLCSLAETSRRLKELTGEVFRRKWTNCCLNTLLNIRVLLTTEGCFQDSREAKRILINFGSVLTKLQIDGSEFMDEKREDVLDCVTRYCSDNLDSLILYSFNIPESFADKLRPIFRNLQRIGIIDCTFKGASKKLFDDCPALVDLFVRGYDNDIAFIPEKSFPELKYFEFECKQYRNVRINLDSFLSRHKNLRVLNTWGCNERLNQSIADNCKQLEKLQYNMTRDTPFDFSSLSRLRELKISFAGQRLTNSLGWIDLNFLVKIELGGAIVDSEFVRLLPQLKELRVLVLWRCDGITNLNQLDDMKQLTKLIIRRSIHLPALDHLIQHLGNLKVLVVDGGSDNLDEETYLKIVKIVGSRNNNSKLTIQIHTYYYGDNKNGKVFIDNKHIVDVDFRCDYGDDSLDDSLDDSFYDNFN